MTNDHRARLEQASVEYLSLAADNPRRLAVELMIGSIGDYGDSGWMSSILVNNPALRDLTGDQMAAIAERVASTVRSCTVTFAFPEEPQP